MNRHYHVLECTPGYMPDSDDYNYCATKREAQDLAAGNADYYRELNSLPPEGQYRISGNKRDGYRIEDRSKMYDLGRVIEIIECTEACEAPE